MALKQLYAIIMSICCFLVLGYFIYNADQPIIEYEYFYETERETDFGIQPVIEYDVFDKTERETDVGILPEIKYDVFDNSERETDAGIQPKIEYDSFDNTERETDAGIQPVIEYDVFDNTETETDAGIQMDIEDDVFDNTERETDAGIQPEIEYDGFDNTERETDAGIQPEIEYDVFDNTETETDAGIQPDIEDDVFDNTERETGAGIPPEIEYNVFDNTKIDTKTGMQSVIKHNFLKNTEIKTGAGIKYDIILNAYKHSGSTATGRILSNRLDTFYVHEPLWQVATHTFYKGPCMFCKDFPLDILHESCMNAEKLCSNKTSPIEDFLSSATGNGGDHIAPKNWDFYYKTLSESSAFLQSILDCDFHRFSEFFYDSEIPRSQKDTIHTIFYHDVGWISFKICRDRKKLPFNNCLKLAEKSCKSAKHRVIKLLRMTLDNLAPLLKTNPRLKVIHLFRDPRGIFNSKVGASLYPVDDKKLLRIRGAVKTMCERLLVDLEASEILKAIYPDRVKVIQYEHFYANPLSDAAKDLYEFSGMEYGSKQQKIIQTNFNKNTGATIGFHPFNYRTKLPWSVIKLFNVECSEVLDRLGYTRYNDKSHLKDLSQSGFATVQS